MRKHWWRKPTRAKSSKLYGIKKYGQFGCYLKGINIASLRYCRLVYQFFAQYIVLEHLTYYSCNTHLRTEGAAGPARYCEVTPIYHQTWKCNIYLNTLSCIEHDCLPFSVIFWTPRVFSVPQLMFHLLPLAFRIL